MFLCHSGPRAGIQRSRRHAACLNENEIEVSYKLPKYVAEFMTHSTKAVLEGELEWTHHRQDGAVGISFPFPIRLQTWLTACEIGTLDMFRIRS